MNEWIDLLKTVIPVVTFILGIFAAGKIEKKKDNYKAEKLHNLLKTEFQDEIKQTVVRITNAFNCMTGLKLLIDELKSMQPRKIMVENLKIIPRKIDTSLIEKHYVDVAHLLNTHQRFGLKIIIQNNAHLNKLIDEIHSLQLAGC